MDALQINKRLHQYRDAARHLLREEYETTIEIWKQMIVNVSKKKNCSLLEGATEMAKEIIGQPNGEFSAIKIFAAYVELTEQKGEKTA